jgi:hypothetical protein
MGVGDDETTGGDPGMDDNPADRIINELTRYAEDIKGVVEDQVTPPPPDPDAPRHNAALILAWLFSASFLLLVAAEMIQAVYYDVPTSETTVTLMLTIGSLLVGLTSGYLARNLNAQPGERYELQTRVGTVLASTLGGMLLIMALAHLSAVIFGDDLTPLSSNALNILVVLFAGIIGALGGYLGISTGQSKDDLPPK